jgi:predicted nucleic acid-binding protein
VQKQRRKLWRKHLKTTSREGRGKVVSTTDLLIAAAAYKKTRLLHIDDDFKRITSIIDLEQEKIER